MIIDNYCYDCDNTTCGHVRDLIGTMVYKETTQYDQGSLEVWRKDEVFTLRFYYDSDVCMNEFTVPARVFA